MKITIILSVLIIHVTSTPPDPPCTYGTDQGQWTANCANLNLQQIPDDVIDPKTRIIDLSDNYFDNNIKRIGGNLIDVIEIKLMECQIKTIYKTTFASLWQLRTLDLRRNGLTAIEAGSFDNNKKLTTLDLAENHLERIDGVFNNNLPIVVLKLNNNHIKYVGPETFLLPKLDELHLQFNDLTTIDLGTQLTLPEKTFIYLNNNPWNCTCDMIPFRKFIMDRLTNQEAIEKKMICSTPPMWENMIFQQIPIDKLECPKEVAPDDAGGAAHDWPPTNNERNVGEPQMAGIPRNVFLIIVCLTALLFIVLLSAIIYLCCKKGLCCWQSEASTQPKTFEDVALMPTQQKQSPISMVGSSQVDSGVTVAANQVAKPPRSLVANDSGMLNYYQPRIAVYTPNPDLIVMRNGGSVENMSPRDYAYRVLNHAPSGYGSGRVSPASSLVSEPPSFAPHYGGMRRHGYAPQHPLNYTTLPRNQVYYRQPVNFPVDKMQMLRNQILQQRRMSLTSEPGYSMAYYDQGMPPSDNQGLRRDRFGGSQTSLNSGRGWNTPNTPATPMTPGSIRSQWDTIQEHDEH